MWALLPVKPLASGFTGQVFLILARFPPLSLRALFQGFCILSLISTLGSWGYPADVDFWDLLAKISPLVFGCLISRLLDSHPHIYLGPMGLSPVVDFWDLSAKINFPPCLCVPCFKAFGFSPSYLPWAHGAIPRCRLLGLVSKNVCFLYRELYPNSSTPCRPLYLSPYSWKAYGIRLNLTGLCNIGKIFHHLPWPAFILGFSALFTLGLVCPHMWEYNLWGFCFSPIQSHALHDSWLEDRHDGADVGLSIHNSIKG